MVVREYGSIVYEGHLRTAPETLLVVCVRAGFFQGEDEKDRFLLNVETRKDVQHPVIATFVTSWTEP